MLRTLYLVDWCLTSDISALLGFVHHTPNLENLTLELCEVYVFHLYNLVNYYVLQSIIHETMVDLFSLILMLQKEMCSQMEIEDWNPIER